MDLHKLIRESLTGEVPPIETEEPEPDVVEEPEPEEPQEAEIPQFESEDIEPPFMPEFGTPAGEPPQRVDVDAVSSSQPSTETRSAGSFQAEVKHEIHVTHSMDADTTQQIADQFGPRFEELKLTIEQQVRDYVDQQIVLLDRGRGGY